MFRISWRTWQDLKDAAQVTAVLMAAVALGTGYMLAVAWIVEQMIGGM